MLETGTSGLMSGEGKRVGRLYGCSVPRPSSTLRTLHRCVHAYMRIFVQGCLVHVELERTHDRLRTTPWLGVSVDRCRGSRAWRESAASGSYELLRVSGCSSSDSSESAIPARIDEAQPDTRW